MLFWDRYYSVGPILINTFGMLMQTYFDVTAEVMHHISGFGVESVFSSMMSILGPLSAVCKSVRWSAIFVSWIYPVRFEICLLLSSPYVLLCILEIYFCWSSITYNTRVPIAQWNWIPDSHRVCYRTFVEDSLVCVFASKRVQQFLKIWFFLKCDWFLTCFVMEALLSVVRLNFVVFFGEFCQL